MLTDNEKTKATSENTCNKIKAIYPHITVSGDIGKPYYNIEWYDIEKQTMYRGYSSYKLSLVRKWLQENFEVVEADIDDLINRQKAEIEKLQGKVEELSEVLSDTIKIRYKEAKTEAVKEFVERLKTKKHECGCNFRKKPVFAVTEEKIDETYKEMVGAE